MSNKLNITPGPWKIMYSTKDHESCLAIWPASTKEGTIGSPICKVSPEHLETKEDNANATAIVTAVNNTYHKGINPEAVPALLGFMKFIHAQNILKPEAQKEISEIIQKATL